MPEIFWQGFYMCLQKVNKRNYRKITKPYCKMVSKELQYGYRKGDALLDHEIFFFLFLEYRVSAILLRLFSFTAVGGHRTGDIPLRVQKGPSETGRAFLHPQNRRSPAHAGGKYDLAPIWWSICLFFCKGHLQSLARRGFVFRLALWYSIYNQFIGCKHESD